MVDLSIYIPRPAGRQSDSNPHGGQLVSHPIPPAGDCEGAYQPLTPPCRGSRHAPGPHPWRVTRLQLPQFHLWTTKNRLTAYNLSVGYLSSFSDTKASMLIFNAIEILWREIKETWCRSFSLSICRR